MLPLQYFPFKTSCGADRIIRWQLCESTDARIDSGSPVTGDADIETSAVPGVWQYSEVRVSASAAKASDLAIALCPTARVSLNSREAVTSDIARSDSGLPSHSLLRV